jgi:hypothetical protein
MTTELFYGIHPALVVSLFLVTYLSYLLYCIWYFKWIDFDIFFLKTDNNETCFLILLNNDTEEEGDNEEEIDRFYYYYFKEEFDKEEEFDRCNSDLNFINIVEVQIFSINKEDLNEDFDNEEEFDRCHSHFNFINILDVHYFNIKRNVSIFVKIKNIIRKEKEDQDEEED